MEKIKGRNPTHTRAATRRGQTTIDALISKYERLRAKYYREAGKATKRNDFEGQMVYACFQMCYTGIMGDLEQLKHDLSARSTNTNVHRKKPKTKSC